MGAATSANTEATSPHPPNAAQGAGPPPPVPTPLAGRRRGLDVDPAGGDRVAKRLVVADGLVGVRDGELGQRPIETPTATEVAGNFGGRAAAGVRPSEGLTAQGHEIAQHPGPHGGEVRRALHVAQLADVVVDALAFGPAEKDVAVGLHDSL